MHVWMDERCRRNIEVGFAGAALHQSPRRTGVVGPKDAPDLDGGIDAIAVERKPPHAPGLGRIREKPVEPIAQFGDLRSIVPLAASITGNKNPRRLGTGKLTVRYRRVEGQPADVPDRESRASVIPALAAVVGPKDAVFGPGQNDAFARHDGSDLLAGRRLSRLSPVAVPAAQLYHAVIGCQNKLFRLHACHHHRTRCDPEARVCKPPLRIVARYPAMGGLQRELVVSGAWSLRFTLVFEYIGAIFGFGAPLTRRER